MNPGSLLVTLQVKRERLRTIDSSNILSGQVKEICITTSCTTAPCIAELERKSKRRCKRRHKRSSKHYDHGKTASLVIGFLYFIGLVP